ncbi:MAG TPA: hypothetical protein VGC18_12115 [Lacisediminihabitans sp.]|uniref:hypothetical protein n=1 Tax=Lacisediminihabitans sp. TaxID=2787631 RepID=UPI002EDA0D0D
MQDRHNETGEVLIDVVRLSDHEWRVSDRNRPESDGLSVIGFVERVGERRFEVTRLGEPGAKVHYPSLDLCVDALARGHGR